MKSKFNEKVIQVTVLQYTTAVCQQQLKDPLDC